MAMIDHEFVNLLLVANIYHEHPSSADPRTSSDYVLSTWLRNSIFLVFIGET